jgi:hypothetical protein
MSVRSKGGASESGRDDGFRPITDTDRYRIAALALCDILFVPRSDL